MATIKGGDKLDAALKEIAAKLSTARTLKVGFLEGSTYPGGTPTAAVAAANEFGVPAHGQPPRSFFRSMVADKSGEWPEAIAENLKATEYDAAKTLNLVGEGIAGQLRQSINELTSPPLAPATIERKGFDKPLIDTSHMVNSVDHEVE